jgi:hypothetical protein
MHFLQSRSSIGSSLASPLASSISLFRAPRRALLGALCGSLLMHGACADAPGIDGQEEGVEHGEAGAALAIPTTAARSLAITAASVLQPCLSNVGLTACGPTGESPFALKRTLGVMLRTAGLTSTVTSQALLARQLWDTQNTIAGAQTLAANPQCNETVNGSGQATINGFPIQCARNEGSMAAAAIDLLTPASADYIYPIALVNRLDLRDAAATTCGEYRILYGRKDAAPTAPTGRALLIFEAAMPNPRPSLGLAGCVPVANLWASLSDPAVTAAAAQSLLATFFYVGTTFTYPDGVSVTVAPVMHYQNLGAARGQVRMNGFMNGSNEARWQLREFKTQLPGDGRLLLRPEYVKSNPWPGLFSAATGSDAFSTWFLGQLPNLVINDLNRFFLADNAGFGAGQSDSQTGAIEGPLGDATQFSSDYALFASPALTLAVTGRLLALGSPLAAVDVYNRATAMSCGGCHQHSNNDLLGGGLVWPASAAFVHVNETPTAATAAPDAFGAAARSFALSPAMTNVFLPFRNADLRCVAFAECPPSLAASANQPMGGLRSE